MAVPFLFFQSIRDGMNDGLNPALLPATQCARMTNIRIQDQLPTTRPGMRIIPCAGYGMLDGLNIQGAIIHNPGRGMSQQAFTLDLARIVLAAGGRKFEIRVRGSSPATATAEITDITGEGLETSADLHLCWLYQAEVYAIGQDGVNCWIWDTNRAFFSEGYSTTSKEKSKLSNEATAGVYSHGRICQVIDSRKILIGDIIHKSNQTSPSNILGMTEQVYWATGSFLSPPSNLGGIVAAAILPKSNTQHGHEETMFHSPDGIFSVNLNIYPRSNWSQTQLTNHAILGSGATGPYALAADDGDQIYRTKYGIQTLRSAAAQPQNLGNPMRPISWQVSSWTDSDHEPYLRFTSLVKWVKGTRVLCTTGIRVEGRRWFADGILSQQLNPVGSASESPAWEGFWTLPPAFPSPAIMVSGSIADSDRCFILVYDHEKNIRLAEIGTGIDHDIDECGDRTEISSQIITAELASGDLFLAKEHTLGTLIFRKIRRTVSYGVWLRAGHDDEWSLWKSGTVTSVRQPGFNAGDSLRRTRDREFRLGLGDVPEPLKGARKVQALIRWRGFAQIEGLRLSAAPSDPEIGVPSDEFVEAETRFDAGDYSDYEYTEGSPWAQSP